MKTVTWVMVVVTFVLAMVTTRAVTLEEQSPADAGAGVAAASPTHCIAFSPYVAGSDPIRGPQPGPELVDQLMQRVRAMGFHCILVYGVTARFDAVYDAAERYGMQVIAIIWLDGDTMGNQASITAGIQRAKAKPQTIVRLSCGSELRVSNDVTVAEPIIRDCLAQVKAAGVTQPVGNIDSWWNWCNGAWPCQTWQLAGDVDWIGVNIYPWWENIESGIFPCITAGDAAAFTVARYQAMRAQYPGKDVLLTEFGWPAGPDGYITQNRYTDDRCGLASAANQRLVVEQTLAALDALGLAGTVFEAFQEPWKASGEGAFAAYWGVCSGNAPYACSFPYGMGRRVYLPVQTGD